MTELPAGRELDAIGRRFDESAIEAIGANPIGYLGPRTTDLRAGTTGEWVDRLRRQIYRFHGLELDPPFVPVLPPLP
jgi:hypothetical protein